MPIKNQEDPESDFTIDVNTYVDIYGPTVDTPFSYKLGKTRYSFDIEEDFHTYGEELTIGSNGNISAITSNTSYNSDEALDCVIINCVVIDEKRIVKADIGIKNGKILGIGQAGNPDIQIGVSSGLKVGPGTQIIDGSNKIVTPGAIDLSLSTLNKITSFESLATGVTTLVSSANGLMGKTHDVFQPINDYNISHALDVFKNISQNLLLICNASGQNEDDLIKSLESGAAGFMINVGEQVKEKLTKLLEFAKIKDIPVFCYTDNYGNKVDFDEFLSVLQSFNVENNSTNLHIFDPGALCDGYVGQNLLLTNEANVFPVSLSFYRDKYADVEWLKKMINITHFANFSDDVTRQNLVSYIACTEAYKTENELIDLGAIPLIGSGGNQLSDIKNFISKFWNISSATEFRSSNDNKKIKNHISKYTSNPAKTLGIGKYVGLIEEGFMADLAIYDMKTFPEEPEKVLISGRVSYIKGAGTNEVDLTFPYPGARFVSWDGYLTNNPYTAEKKLLPVSNCHSFNKRSLSGQPEKNVVVQYIPGEVYDGHNTSTYVIEQLDTFNKLEDNIQKQIDGNRSVNHIKINSNSDKVSVKISNHSEQVIAFGSHELFSNFSKKFEITVSDEKVSLQDILRPHIPSGFLEYFYMGDVKKIWFLKKKQN